MPYASQRDAIAAKLESIPNIGRVHARPRYGDAFDHWVTTLNGVDQIRAWEIGLGDPGIAPRRIQQAHRHKYVTFSIRGYLSLVDDAGDGSGSYDTIVTLAETIGNTLDADQRISDTMIDHEPTQIQEPLVVTIGGGALCWGITLNMTGYAIESP